MDIFEIAEISALQSKAGFKAVPRLNTRKLIQEIGTYSIPSEMKALVYEFNKWKFRKCNFMENHF